MAMFGNRASYPQTLLSQAQAKYPFIKQFDPLVSTGQGEGYAETWHTDDPGAPDYPRPAEFPMGRVGVQIFQPDKFGVNDLAGEMLHVDPRANETRRRLLASLTPEQLANLKAQSRDYQESVKPKDQGGYGMTEGQAVNNMTDAAMRGYTVGQWPAEANAQMNYIPAQQSMLDHLQRYMLSGRDPDNAFGAPK